MLRKLYLAAASWTALGLASGLFYREFTKHNGVAGGTQLAVVHTHTLTLGTIFMLVLMALVGAFPQLAEQKWFSRAFITWQIGLVLTAGGLTVKGCLQVLKSDVATSPAIAGFSGLGHMTLTAAFVMLFMALRSVVTPTKVEVATEEAARA